MTNCQTCTSKKVSDGMTHCNVCAHVVLYRIWRTLDGLDQAATKHAADQGDINNALAGLVHNVVEQVRDAWGRKV